MSIRQTAVCLFLLAAIQGGIQLPAQVRDTSLVPLDGAAGDSLVAPVDGARGAAAADRSREFPGSDSAAVADTGMAPLLDGLGSVTAGMLPAALLRDSGLSTIPLRSAGDIAGAVEGLFRSTAGLPEVGRKFSVHGMRDGSVAFLSDGLLLNSPATGLFDPSLYPIEQAGQVEAVSSPSAYALAPNAVGGAVNFVSRAARNAVPASHIFYTQSAYNFTVLDAWLRQDVARGMNVDLGLQRPVADGRYANSAFDAWNTRLKLRYDFDGAAVYVSDLYNRWTRGLNDGVSLSTPDSLRFDPYLAQVVNESATERIVRHDAAAGIAAGSDTSALTTFDAQYSWSRREYIDEAGDRSPTRAPFRETRDEQTTGLRLSHSRSIGPSRIFATGELRSRRVLRDPNIGGASSMLGAVALSAKADPVAGVSLVPTARYERFMDVDRLSFGATGKVRIAPWLSAVGGINRAYRHPSFAELRGVLGLAAPLAAADPERHDVSSVGVDAGDPEGTRVSARYVHRVVHGGIILDSSGVPDAAPLAYARTGRERRDGVTISAALSVGIFLAEGEVTFLAYGGDSRRRYAPEWDLRGGIYVDDRLIDGHLRLKTGFRARHFSSYDGEGYAGRYGLFVPAGAEVGPADVIDFVLFAGIGDAVIHIIWENLLDEQYAMTVFTPADDRSFRLGVSWKFLE